MISLGNLSFLGYFGTSTNLIANKSGEDDEDTSVLMPGGFAPKMWPFFLLVPRI